MRHTWALLWLAACGTSDPSAGSDAARPAKIYVISQHHAAVDVLDGTTLAIQQRIPTGDRRMPHMLEIAGDQVWLSNLQLDGTAPDEVLLIDPHSDTIAARVEVDVGAYVQHLVLSPDGATLYVGGLGTSMIYRIDTRTRTRGVDIHMPQGRSPHGLRMGADGAHLYVATTKSSVVELDTATGMMTREFMLPGPGLQLALAGGVLYATVPEPATVCRIDLATAQVTDWPLPAATPSPASPALIVTALGPRVAVTEQGDPSAPGGQMLLLDPASGQIASQLRIGQGNHGMAITSDGRLAFVSGMYDDSLHVIDLQAGTDIQHAVVDPMPAGVGLWSP